MKHSSNFVIIIIIFQLILAVIPFTVNAQTSTVEIPLTLRGQDTTKSCWAASSQMVLEFYGTYGPALSQLQISRELGSEDYFNNGLPAGTAIFGTWTGAINRLGKVSASNDLILTFEDVVNDVNLNRPIIALYAGDAWIIPNLLPYHAVIIAGYIDNPGETNDQVVIYDPWPSDSYTFPSPGERYVENWQSVKNKLYLATNAIRTAPQLEKGEISINVIEQNTQGILRFTITSTATSDWWTDVKKWDSSANSWSSDSIPGTSVQKHPGET